MSTKVIIKSLVAEYTTTQFDYSNPVYIDRPQLAEYYVMILTENELTLTDCPKKAFQRRSEFDFKDIIVLKIVNLKIIPSKTIDDYKLLKIVETKPTCRRTFKIIFKNKEECRTWNQLLNEVINSNIKLQVFGVPLIDYHQRTNKLYPIILDEICEIMRNTNECFSQTVSQNEILMTLNLINKGIKVQKWNYTLATEVLKLYLRSLPFPLLHPSKEYLGSVNVDGILSKNDLSLLIHTKTEENIAVQKLLFTTFHFIANNQVIKTPRSIAEKMTPCLAWDSHDSLDKRMYDIVEFLISNATEIYKDDKKEE
ncbi:hypothetical protein ENUP19_0092G0038 [Entamoeba nuttalli]|uniref:RhoGAP domain containing protein n=1 Tax=Entamoeba nuttalli TaxID=412467 RepID=A0ABQ0DGV5_9EUKA